MSSAAGTARWVLHLDMDSFFASVEQLTRPTLRGRPVLVGGAGPRGVVAGASYEARVYGARSAMPMHQARRLVGAPAVVLPPRGSIYRVASHRVFRAVRGLIPVIEQLSLDEAFGEPEELAGATPEQVAAYCTELRQKVFDATGLAASVGAGPGKQVAKIASGLAKPHGQRVIAAAERRTVMDALPVRKLWGIGPVAESRLRKVGIETIGDFADLEGTEAEALLGRAVGQSLHRLARGIDDRAVTERAEAKQVSAETTFPQDLMTRAEVRAAVQTTGEAAFERLTKDGRGARTIVVKLRKADMSTVTRSATLAYASGARDTLLGAAQRLAIDPAEIGPIRLVGVAYAGLSAVQQTILFPDLDTAEQGEERGGAEPGEVADSANGSEEVRIAPGSDVHHAEHGHGWVQGIGHGVVTVRFETRASGPGPARTFAWPGAQLVPADPVRSLDWDVPDAGAEVDDGM